MKCHSLIYIFVPSSLRLYLSLLYTFSRINLILTLNAHHLGIFCAFSFYDEGPVQRNPYSTISNVVHWLLERNMSILIFNIIKREICMNVESALNKEDDMTWTSSSVATRIESIGPRNHLNIIHCMYISFNSLLFIYNCIYNIKFR